MNSSGDITKCVVPSRQGVFSFSTTWPAALLCTRSLVSAGRVMVRLSCSSAWRQVGAAANGSVQAETLHVGTQVLFEVRLPWHCALQRQQLLAGARAEGDAIRTRGGLQRPERAGFVQIAVVVSQVGRTLLFDQRTPPGQQLASCG